MTALKLAGPAMMLALAACTGGTRPAVTPAPVVAAPPPAAGLDRVMGKSAETLQGLFGEPDQDSREEGSRRLQFSSPVCVLDTYLYAPARGQNPVVTYLDARRPSGEDFDRASCIAALVRRKAAQ